MTGRDPSGEPPEVTVVVPAFNELATIEAVLERLDAVPVRKEIVVVDDGSTDGTRERLEALAAGDGGELKLNSPLEVVLQPENRGKGAALRAGFARASGRVTIVQDADLEYDPAEIPRLVAPILAGEADAVFGSRFAAGPWRRRYGWHGLGNRALTTASNLLTGLTLTDMETCYKAIRTDVLRAIPLSEDRFGFEPEVTAHLARLGVRIREMPIGYEGRGYEDGKKIGWRDGVEAFRVMARCWRSGASRPKGAG